MQNETFCFIDDIRQKKAAATGAHHKIVKTGCKLPYEYLPRKELEKLMNNTVISTNPMPYKAFKILPREEQQRQLDMWGERYGKSVSILASLLNCPHSTAALLLKRNTLDFKCETHNGSNADKAKYRQLKALCDAFYGRSDAPESYPPEEVKEPAEKEILPETKEPIPEPLANPSRFNLSFEGVFTSDEIETLLRSVRAASCIDPDKKYNLSLSLTEN